MRDVRKPDISHNQCHLGEDGSVSVNVNVKGYVMTRNSRFTPVCNVGRINLL